LAQHQLQHLPFRCCVQLLGAWKDWLAVILLLLQQQMVLLLLLLLHCL
jgi:hypothetical protein